MVLYIKGLIKLKLDNLILLNIHLVDVFYKHIIKSVQHLIKVILVEAGEHHLDVLIQEQVNGWAPELSLQSGVDGHHYIRPLDLLGLDKSRED